MKILFVSGKYLPGKSGGIENYCHLLATILLKRGHNVHTAILQGSDMKPYTYEGVEVFPLTNKLNSFIYLLKNNNYDLCHFHEYSGENGINIKWFREARQYCKKVFFTFHLPYLTCYKNDFRYRGIEDCDNFSDPERCLQCIIATRLHYKSSKGKNLYNASINVVTPILKKFSAIKHIRNHIDIRRDELKELITICHRVFLIAGWFKKILEKNGYENPGLRIIPPIYKTESFNKYNNERPIKHNLVFAGRIERQKGLHLICKALSLDINKSFSLDVFGNMVDEKYFNDCMSIYTFNYKGTVSREDILKALPDYDFLILPSVFTEMYSMILQEAFHKKLPVIASAAKGNVELVEDGINGFLFDYDDHKDLARVIDNAYNLKKAGWQPVFETNDHQEKDSAEIISYYSFDKSVPTNK